MYYRKAQIALICYDSSNRNSFNAAKEWFKQVTENADKNCVKILVGNKNDIVDTIVVNDAVKFCEKKKLDHLVTSSKNNLNIDELFLFAAHKGLETNKSNSKLELETPNLSKERYNYCCYQ